MTELLNSLIEDCKLYITTFQQLVKENKTTEKEKVFYGKIRELYPLLLKLQEHRNKTNNNNPEALHQRFLELLAKANKALLDKGLAAVSIPSNDTPIV